MDKIKGPKVKAWWFNPRDGKAKAIGHFKTPASANSRRPITATSRLGACAGRRGEKISAAGNQEITVSYGRLFHSFALRISVFRAAFAYR